MWVTELRGGELALRDWREDDALAVYEACQDPEVQRWIPTIPRPYTEADALAFVTGELELGPHSYAEVGFQREGVLRSHLQHPDGRRRDSVLFSLLPGELV
jgi:RimJ/RimL family protein N-acetyltransferase